MTGLFERGLSHFSAGRFYEAHEDWEHMWMAAEGSERLALQGLIQTAAACLHAREGREAPARRLFLSAAQKLDGLPTYKNIRLACLVCRLRELGGGPEKPEPLASLTPFFLPAE